MHHIAWRSSQFCALSPGALRTITLGSKLEKRDLPHLVRRDVKIVRLEAVSGRSYVLLTIRKFGDAQLRLGIASAVKPASLVQMNCLIVRDSEIIAPLEPYNIKGCRTTWWRAWTQDEGASASEIQATTIVGLRRTFLNFVKKHKITLPRCSMMLRIVGAVFRICD